MEFEPAPISSPAPIPMPAGRERSSSSSSSSSPSAWRKEPLKEKIRAILSSFNRNIAEEYFEIMQLAGEKFGRAQTTPFPQEYLDLEMKIENMKKMHQNLIKIAAMQIYPSSGTSTLSLMGSLAQLGQSPPISPSFASLKISSLSPFMSIAEELVKIAKETGDDTPLGSALYAWAESQKKIGSSRLQMGMELHERFVLRLAQNLDSEIANVENYRRKTRESRVKLDTLKGRVKSMPPNKAEQFEDELRTAQNKFTDLIQKTTEAMTKALQTPIPLIALTEYMESMYAYFKSGYETLSLIAPELHALRKAEESIFEPPPGPSFSVTPASSHSAPLPSTSASPGIEAAEEEMPAPQQISADY